MKKKSIREIFQFLNEGFDQAADSFTDSDAYNGVVDEVKGQLTWADNEDELTDIIYEFETKDDVEFVRKFEEVGCKVEIGDSGIDDGLDDGPDKYLMYQSYDVIDSRGERKWIKLYYGNNTEEITYQEIR